MCEKNDLDVGFRISRAKEFSAILMELTIPTLLRTFVPKQRSVVPQARCWLMPHQVVFDRRTHDGCCHLRTQGQRVAPTILERVHFLADNVGPFTYTTLEQLGVLNHGRAELTVAKGGRHRSKDLLSPMPGGHLGAVDVAHPAHGLDHVRLALLRRSRRDLRRPQRCAPPGGWCGIAPNRPCEICGSANGDVLQHCLQSPPAAGRC